MKLQIFAIYDSKAMAYLPPFFLPNNKMAERSFGEAANSETHQFGKHPADYTLFHIGEFDDATATIISAETKIGLGTALEHQRVDVNPNWFEELEETDPEQFHRNNSQQNNAPGKPGHLPTDKQLTDDYKKRENLDD